MKNKLILHIGFQKTGTTAIQNFLFNNARILNKYKYSYPEMQKGKFNITNGYCLRNCVTEFGLGKVNNKCESWKIFWDKTRDELKKNNVIISWEGISTYNIDDFFSAVKNEYDNIKVIVYLRRQDRYIESLYNQLVKYEINLAIKFKNIWDLPEYRMLFSYKYKLDKISKIIGKENIIVRVYEKEQFKGDKQDAVSDFMYALGIDVNWNEVKTSKKILNPALFGNFIDIKREMNLYIKPFDKISRIVDYTIFNYLELNIRNSEINHNQGLFTPEERIKFLNQFEKENKEIAYEYLGREDGVLFHNDKMIQMHKPCFETLVSDIKGVFNYLFKKLKSKQEFSILYLEEAEHLFYSEIENIEKDYNDCEELKLRCFDLVKKCTALLTDYGREKYKKIMYLTEKIKNKKVFIFGTGGYSTDFVRETGVLPDLFLDNNKNDETIFNIKIVSPDCIFKRGGAVGYLTIIAVKNPQAIDEMEKQLKSYGLKKDEDYIIGIEFFDSPYLESYLE